MKKLLLSIGFLLTLAVHSLSAKENTNDTNFSEAQLAQMLAPIALYPDSLLTHILIASTYPIEVVEAERWISKKSDLSVEKISKKLESKDWEPSVKALVMFPKVLERLSDDLSWTQQLGDAFLQSEEDVLEAIQDLRYQAEQAGSLNKMENVKVTREKKNIIIQPVQKEVVYVPYYDTRHVYGDWHWSMNPPIYWDWGHHVSLSHHNPFRWHSGIHISLNYFFSAFHWNNRHVVVVDHRNTRRYRAKKHIVRGGYANRWAHKPHHRRGVTYRSERINNRFKSNRPVVHKTVNRHHNSPKQFSNKKSYSKNQHGVQAHKSFRSNTVKSNAGRSTASNTKTVHVKRNNNASFQKASKHEALQRKFKNNSGYNKAVQRNKAVVHKNTKVVNRINTPKYKAPRDSRDFTQIRTFNNKSVTNNKPSIQVQHRTEKPVFKQNRSIEHKATYTPPKRNNDYYKKSTRSQSTRSAPVRKSHTSTKHSSRRQER
jgi:hypothetical protein